LTDYEFYFEINEITLNLRENFHWIVDPFTDFDENELKFKDELKFQIRDILV